jgi:hypothetical protein
VNTELWTSRIEAKGMDPEAMAADLAGDPQAVEFLLQGMDAKKARIKYGCDKVLRAFAAAKPDLAYPHFDRIAGFLDSGNSFLRWGAIQTLSYLAAADTEGRFIRIFRKYYAPIQGTEMVAAASVIGGSPRIARALPELRGRIVREILKVEKTNFLMHGRPSPECGLVACGHALEALEEMYPDIADRKKTDAFIRRQVDCPRPAVRRKALRLVKQLGL